MARIEEAFDVITKKKVRIKEYKDYLENNEFPFGGVRSLKCLECGDYITYCEGEINKPYFKHSPTAEGHPYCSLYTEGVSSNTLESKLRKKIFEEENVSLNYEIIYQNGERKSIIVLPPFKNSEIENFEQNNTVINLISDDYFDCFEISIPINRENFSRGEVKKIALKGFPSKIKIKITGNSTKENISYNMDCFKPDYQLYSSLILQKYSVLHKDDDFIDLSNLPFFSCKKIDGNLYIGEHYLTFSRNKINKNKQDAIFDYTLKEIKLKSKVLGYYLYDIVFNSKNFILDGYLSQFNCVLLDRAKPNIIWPPLNRVGNYSYFKIKKSSKLFLTHYEKNKINLSSIELTTNDKKAKSFFKILENERPFYVSNDRRKIEDKQFQKIDNGEIEQDDEYKDYFQFKNDVLVSQIDKKEINDKYGTLYFNNQLDRYFKNVIVNSNTELNEFLNIIRYSRKFEIFTDDDFNFLVDIYKDNKDICIYLERCKQAKTIKSEVKKFLLERS